MANGKVEKMYVISDEQTQQTREVIIVQADTKEAADDYVQNVRPKLPINK